MGQQHYNPYARAVQKAEDSKQIIEEYLMGPESVQVVEAIGDILLSWEVMVMYGIFLLYRLARNNFKVFIVKTEDDLDVDIE